MNQSHRLQSPLEALDMHKLSRGAPSAASAEHLPALCGVAGFAASLGGVGRTELLIMSILLIMNILRLSNLL